jgi:homeobox protein cut-like
MTELRNEIKSLQADNLKLYEKVRYMQSYTDDGGMGAAGPSTSRRGEVLSSSASSSKRDDALWKYRSKYEESMNPFEAFRGRVLLLFHL